MILFSWLWRSWIDIFFKDKDLPNIGGDAVGCLICRARVSLWSGGVYHRELHPVNEMDVCILHLLKGSRVRSNTLVLIFHNLALEPVGLGVWCLFVCAWGLVLCSGQLDHVESPCEISCRFCVLSPKMKCRIENIAKRWDVIGSLLFVTKVGTRHLDR